METCSARFRARSLALVLLMCFFVPEAAADCKSPDVKFQGMETLILTDETMVMNRFPDGVTITLECAHGYFHASGSRNVSCVDGMWAKPDMVCKKKNCGQPKPMLHMSFNTSGGTLFGAVVKATCDKGYRIEGVSYMECYPNGWKGKASCHIVKCALPVEVTNGTFKWTSSEKPKYGDVVEYSCDDGYFSVGNTLLRCTESGKYDTKPPKCEDLRVATTNSDDRITSPFVLTTSAIQETTATAAATTTADRDRSLTTPATPRRGNKGEEDTIQKETTDAPSTVTSVFGGSLPVIITVTVVVVLIGIAAGIFLQKFLLRRKGSYDTREDLKPELLSFQNL